ncbi:MAG: helix-turn-helix domain-containing protein [Actinomycetota bacterium]
MSGRPVTDQERERVRALHAEGLSCARIAREIGRAKSTVSGVARDLGLSFDRSKTREATAAQVDDAKARRARLALKLLGLAEQEADEFNQPCTLHSFGGKDHTYNSKTVPRPPARERRDMAATINILVDRHARLTEMDADQQGLAAVDAWLRGITGTT